MNDKDQQSKKEVLQTLVRGSSKYIEELKSRTASKNSQGAAVSYEVFDQAMEWMTENLRQVYEMLHDLIMEKECRFEFKFGEIQMCVGGSENYREFYAGQAKILLDILMGTLLDKDRIRDIKHILEKKHDEQNKPYA